TAQLIPGRNPSAPIEQRAPRPVEARLEPAPRTGIERMLADEADENAEAVERTATVPQGAAPRAESGVIVPEVSERADSSPKHKTTMPRIAGGFKLPPSSLLHRPDGQQSVDADELKLLAQVLTEKY